MGSEPVPRGAALLDALESGELRVAEPGAGGAWVVHAAVKEAILDLFREGEVVPMGNELPRESYQALDLGAAPYRDKDLLRVRRFNKRDGVRMVPGGSAVRRGAHLAQGVVCMPPMYVNVGAWIGAGAIIMADVGDHAIVGAGAVVNRPIPSGVVAAGVPAKPKKVRPGFEPTEASSLENNN